MGYSVVYTVNGVNRRGILGDQSKYVTGSDAGFRYL